MTAQHQVVKIFLQRTAGPYIGSEAVTCKPEQETPDNAGAKFTRDELKVHDDGAVEASQALGA